MLTERTSRQAAVVQNSPSAHAVSSECLSPVTAPAAQLLDAANDPVVAALAHLQILRLRFLHRLEQDAIFTPFKGAIWHGVFGKALKAIDEGAYAVLFDTDARSAPWRLIAPPDADTHMRAGTTLSGEIILFNEAITYAPACAEAIFRMGEHGLGEKRSHATLESLTGHIDDQEVSLAKLFALNEPNQCGIQANSLFTASGGVVANQLTLRFLTPLSLKVGGEPHRESPSALMLVLRLLSRLNGLLPEHDGQMLSPQQLQHLLAVAKAINIVRADVEWFAWERYSARQKSTMPFGGLLGQVQYQGAPSAIERILPWLRVAEWVGLGSKTTFGQGQILVRAMATTTTDNVGTLAKSPVFP